MNKFFLLSLSVLVLAVTSCSKTKKLAKQHDDLLDTYVTLKRDMPEAQVSMDGEKVKVVLPEAVLFTINSAEVNREYYPVLGKMAAILNKYPKTNILITGFTDITGTAAYNNNLSLKRAESAKSILQEYKVKSNRMFTWGLGASNPIADNDTESGRNQNRRVEYVILYDYKEGK
jgi:outer membrane protein OmpA-like peptidoglycan-associated protein